jgi:hypothetical protein
MFLRPELSAPEFPLLLRRDGRGRAQTIKVEAQTCGNNVQRICSKILKLGCWRDEAQVFFERRSIFNYF